MPTILVMDDDDLIREMLSQVLGAAGYEVVLAPDAEIGMRLCREHPTDLIITDIVMPKVDGWQSIVELRKEFPHVSIIAISGGHRVGPLSYLVLAKRFGADLIFQKPLKKDELLAAVHGLLQSGRSEAQPRVGDEVR